MGEVFPLTKAYEKGFVFADRLRKNDRFRGIVHSSNHTCGILSEILSLEQGKTAVEFGVSFGGSLIVMAHIAKELYSGIVYGIDRFQDFVPGSIDADVPDVPVTPIVVLENAKLVGLERNIVLLPENVYPLPLELEGLIGNISLVHIDVDRDYNTSRAALFTAKNLNPNFIVIQGYGSESDWGVVRAVRDFVLYPEYTLVHISGEVAVFERIGNELQQK